MDRVMWDLDDCVLDDCVVKRLRVTGRDLPSGRYRIMVTTMDGVVVEDIDAPNRAEAERELAALGYARVPPNIAFEIDEEARRRVRRKKPDR